MPKSRGYILSNNYSDSQKDAIRDAMRSLSDVVDVTFHEGRSDLRHVKIAMWTIDGPHKVLGQANSMRWANAQLVLDRADSSSLHLGGRQYQVLLHELGHVLGLGHSSEGRLGSVMQSRLQWHSKYAATTLLAYDIARAQDIWGASKTSNGDNVYTLTDGTVGGKKLLSCIWDSGGVDKIVYNGSAKAFIDLRPASLTKGAEDENGGLNTVANGSAMTIARGAIIENATTGSGDDTLRGNEADNVLEANAGDDVLEGWGGDDTLLGGAGDDRLDGGAGDDTLDGGAGDDVLEGGDGDDRLDGRAGADVLAGGAGDDKLNGGAGDDELNGGAGSDKLAGGAGDDKLVGGTGDDSLDGGVGADVLNGGAGADKLTGGDGADILRGDDGSDLLLGGDGADRLLGGRGDDRLEGQAGDDVLTGNQGSDTFVFTGASFGRDRISDFSVDGPQQDVIEFSEEIFEDWASLSEHMTQVGKNVVITCDAGALTLSGVMLSQLSANDFLFV